MHHRIRTSITACGAVALLALATLLTDANAAKTKGNVKVLGIRVTFADHSNAPSEATIGNRLQGAKVAFERYSYGKLTIQHDTVSVQLPQNRASYSASSLASQAETRATAKGFREGAYDIIGFFHGGHSAGNKGIVGGKRFWTSSGGATIHEMGHVFGWGHQSRWASDNSNPIGSGELVTPDMWHFMANSSIDPEPYEKWQREWITDRHNITSDGSYTKRLYTFDQKNTSTVNSKRVLRVTRKTSTSKAFWIGYRSRSMNNQNSGAGGKNSLLRQGLVFYWDRADPGGASHALIDMHPSGGGWDDHSLQPGETYDDNGGEVYITNLGRAGTAPDEYIDVQVNRGDFSGNSAPEPTWDAPKLWMAGEPLTITITPNDPDGDEVACMWTTGDRATPYNRSAPTLTKTWNNAGSYRVRAVVSDMKGNTATLARTVTVTGTEPISFANATFDRWTETTADTTWTTDVLVEGVRAATAMLDVTNFTGEFVAAETAIANITAGGHPLARVSVEDPVNGNGNESVSSAIIRLAITDVDPAYTLDGISLSSNSAVFSPEKLTNVQFDGDGTTVVDASSSPNIVAGGVGAVPVALDLDGTVNFSEPGAWDNANGFTSDAHSLKWSVDAAGSTFLSAKFTTEAPPALTAERLVFGVGLRAGPDPSLITFEQWVATTPGLPAERTTFEADLNSDGVANGLAFLLGAQSPTEAARPLLPTWQFVRDGVESPGEIVFAFRRSDDAARTVQAAVEFTSDFSNWTTAVDGQQGITVSSDDDFYEPGIDRVEVRLPAELAPAGILYLRLKASR